MEDLHWTWLAAPFAVLTVLIAAVALSAALVRGDRVLRLGMSAAALTALPWAMCQGLAACTDDAELATRLLRVGQGPVALVGPYLLLVLLAASGQLELHRWVARSALWVGTALMALAWATPWTFPSVRRLSSGMFYTRPGPLTAIHISQLAVWLAVGMWIVQRSTAGTARKRTMQLLLGVLACCAIGACDLLLLYDVWGSYPFAPVPATIAAGIALYLVLRTDLLRPRGVDRGVGLELVAFAVAGLASLLLAVALRGASLVALSALASLVWVVATGGAWAISKSRPMRVVGERALEQFAARATMQVDERELANRLASLWQKTIGVTTRTVWVRAGDALVELGGTSKLALDAEVARWLVRHSEPLAHADLATMRLGALRGRLERFVSERGSNLLVPLVDRGELVAVVEGTYETALREDERGLVAESARAAARGLVFAALARAADRERETAREVEIADALRLHAQADSDRIKRWSVAVERHGARALRAGWSAIETGDGRLALLVIEASAETPNISAALALAAATGAFAAALAGRATITLTELVAALRTSGEGIAHGGVTLAAFVAFFDEGGDRIEWACAGHRGGELVDSEHVDGERTRLEGTGARAMPATAILVVASARGDAPALELTVRRRPG